MIKNNVKLFNRLNCFFNFSNWVTNFLGDLCPDLVDIIDLINVQCAWEWTKLAPDFLVDFKVKSFTSKFHSIFESIFIGCWTSVNDPADSFKTNTSINDFNV
jgi:hypothetical protein